MGSVNSTPTQTRNNEKDDKEHYSSKRNGFVAVYGILHLAAFIFAIYLSFKCHGGFDFWSFVVAFFCPWIYIVWVLATKKGMCLKYEGGVPPTTIVV